MTQPAQGEQIVPYSLLKSQILFPGTGFLLGWNSMSSSTVKDVFIFFYLLFLNIAKKSHLHIYISVLWNTWKLLLWRAWTANVWTCTCGQTYTGQYIMGFQNDLFTFDLSPY